MVDNSQAGKFKEMIRAETPDIVSINEVDEWWSGSLTYLKKSVSIVTGKASTLPRSALSIKRSLIIVRR